MTDVFISYSRSDSAWVEEDLLPALKEIGATYFLDDAEWRKRRESIEGSGLLPGDDIAAKLASALSDSRVIALIHSPAYFASKWCRSELELAEKLAAKSGGAADGVKLIYLILKKYDERLDLTPGGERVLHVDLTSVLERAAKLSFALQMVSSAAAGCSFRLGQRSLQDLLDHPTVRRQVDALRLRHRQFRAAHARMQAFKEVHDALQRAQDAWRALAKVRDEITAGKAASPRLMVADLIDRCSHIQAAFDAPPLQGEWAVWAGTLQLAIDHLTTALAQEQNLDALNLGLELTSGLLFLSPLAAEMNVKIRTASRELPIELLRQALAPLRALEKCPWQDSPRAQLGKVLAEFDGLEKLLAGINDLVEVHDVLQSIDSVFSVAVHVEAKLVNIEAIWPGIELQRQKIQPRMLASITWLHLLGSAAETMNAYLRQTPKPVAPPREHIEFFKAQLNQSFTRADFDLRTGTSRLEQRHDTIDDLLLQLATPPNS